MPASIWKPLDLKAIAWWAQEHHARLTPPFAWPQITYLDNNGEHQIIPLQFVRSDFDKWRKEQKRGVKDRA